MPVPAWVVPLAAGALSEAASGAGEAATNAALNAAGRGICNAHANNPSVVGSLGSFATSFVDGACAPYYADEGITPPFYQTPFTGGQCSGLPYEVSILFTDQVGGQNGYVATLFGPITAIYTEPNETRTSLFTYVTARLTPTGPLQEFTGGPYSWDNNSAPAISVEPIDHSDACGNPPNADIPSPNAPPQNWGDEIGACFLNGVCIPITLNEPLIDVDGNLSIPIQIGPEEVDFGPKLGPGGGGAPPTPPPATGGDPIEDPEEPGEVCIPQIDGQQCIGVFWTLVNTGQTPVGLPGSGGSAVYPRTIGNIRLRYGACGAGPLGDQNEIRCAQGTIFRGSENLNVAGFIINKLPQFEGTYVPLYIQIEED